MYKILKINRYSFIVKTLLLGAFTLLLAASTPLFSQTSGGISGKVSSVEFPEGLPGVTVLIKGSTIGTSTNTDGSYSIKSLPKDATLIFSYIGFNTQEISVNGKSIINVELIENTNVLSEIVVTGLSLARDKNSLGYSITGSGTFRVLPIFAFVNYNHK